MFKRNTRLMSLIFIGALFLLANYSLAHAVTFTAFGPKTFVRGSGKPIVETASFNIKNPNTAYTLKIYNGGINSEDSKVSSASIKLNGSSIFDTKDFNQQASYLQKQVSVNKNNDLSVELRSAPGSGLTISIEGVDDTPPSVIINSPTNGTYLNIPSTTISGTTSDSISWVNTVTVNGTIAALTGEAYNSGIQLTEGANNITATATDAAGNTGSAIVSVILDTIPPKITIDPIPSLTNMPHLTITGKIEDANPISSLTVNGTPATLTNNAFTASNIPLTEGSNSITVTATDAAGNKGTGTIAITRSSDTTPPIIAITSPSSGNVVNTSSITIAGTIDDNTAIVTVNGITAAVSNNAFTASGIHLTEGQNSIVVLAVDPSGNKSTQSVIVYLDTTPPQIQLFPEMGFFSPIAYATMNKLITKSSYINIGVNVRDNLSSYDTVTYTGNFKESFNPINFMGGRLMWTDAPGTPIRVPNGAYFPVWFFGLTEGADTITVSATDWAGNKSSSTITVYSDTKAPVVSITLPTSVTSEGMPVSIVNNTSITVTGTVVDDNLSTISVGGRQATIVNNTFTASNVSLNEGGNIVAISAVDFAGNTSNSQILLICDTTPPVISIMSPMDKSTVDGDTITITGTIRDMTGSYISAPTIKVNGINTTVANDTFTVSNIKLIEGANTINITAVDMVGNTATSAITITYMPDKTPPIISITSPTNDKIVTTMKTTVTGTIDDNMATVTVNEVNATVSNNIFSAAGIILTEGENVITATAKDLSGNMSSIAIIVYCDTTGPKVLSTAPAADETVTSDSSITVAFSEAINIATVTTGTFTLYNSLGSIPGSIAASGNTATFRPLYTLDSKMVYTVTIRGGYSGVKDLIGWPMTSDYIWSFKTGIGSLDLNITDPQSGATINKGQAIVRGTIQPKTIDTGVTVNGVIAEVNGNTWAAIIPLQIGQNTIEVKAVDALGNADKRTISIAAESINQPVTITTNPQSGIASLNTALSIETTISNPIMSYKIDFEGDGVTDIETTDVSNIAHIYDTPGIYYPTVTVTDNQGNTYMESTAINVLDKAQMDTLLKGKWDGMKGAMGSGDVDSAITAFEADSQDTYKAQFTALKSALNAISVDMGQINLVTIEDRRAEYEIIAARNGVTYSFYLLFVKDQNGLWKIKEF